MALLDLLKDPNAYKFNSKGLKYQNPPLLGERVTFDVTNAQANPTYTDGTIDHATPVSEDVFARGGITVANDRRQTDKDRSHRTDDSFTIVFCCDSDVSGGA